MSNLQENHINPFDNESLSFQILENQQGEFNLWLAQHQVPSGWVVQHGPDTPASCIVYVEKHWLAIAPFQQA
ncbi:MbtH family NRPS accessory protein [Acinetobacter geminorum]